jgi:hypothetical protein
LYYVGQNIHILQRIAKCLGPTETGYILIGIGKTFFFQESLLSLIQKGGDGLVRDGLSSHLTEKASEDIGEKASDDWADLGDWQEF